MKNFEGFVTFFFRASSKAVALFCLLALVSFTMPVGAQKELRRSGVINSEPDAIAKPVTGKYSSFKQAKIDAETQWDRGRTDMFRGVATSGLVPTANPTFFAYDYGEDRIVTFNANDPGTILTDVSIKVDPPGAPLDLTGLDQENNERLEFIDIRPNGGGLYAIARKQGSITDDICRVVVIAGDGTLTTIGTPTNCGTDALFFGGDFNPVVDLLRETDRNDGNRRWSPATGTLVATDGTLQYASGDPNSGDNPSVVHVAYTHNFTGAASTTLYGIDVGPSPPFNPSNVERQARLVTIGSVGGGPVSPNTGQLFTVGSLGLISRNFGGFDIHPGTTLAYAALFVNGASTLYSIDLTTGAATEIGLIGDGTLIIDGLTIGAGGAAANLSITKTDNFDTYVPGSVRPYTIIATNSGADPVAGALVTDTMTAQFSSFAWTCTGSNGGTCPASGTGSINALVNLPVGGSVTFQLNATVAPGTSGNLVNVATISAPNGVADSSSANNSDDDQNTLLTTSAGVLVSGRVMAPDGRGLRGTPVTIIDSEGVATTVMTSSLGYYTFNDVEPGGTFIVGVNSRRYRFTSRVIQVADSLTDIDFIGIE